MGDSIGSVFKSFWHTLTSNDRHSSFDSPNRTGRHVPLHNGSIMTGVATASDSRADITSPYADDFGRSSPHLERTNTSYAPGSPVQSPYSPGLRSASARNASQTDGFEVQSPGDVPMQSFEQGIPPPPPPSHSWKRIDAWAEENYPELFDQLGEPATNNDLNDLEHQLDCTLPQDVRDSLMCHDGQERWGTPTGIIFGSMLLDCEEIVQEWEQWKKVNHQYLLENSVTPPTQPSKAFGGSGNGEGSSTSSRPSSASRQNGEWRQDLLSKQDCIPPNSVKKVYSHPAWIPLVRDWGGNNLAVDLSPGPNGKWGQIVLFGRDYDTKYVVARSWASFLAIVASDLNSGKWFVDEETHELKLREFKEQRVEPPYFSILRWRMDQKHGRRAAQRKSMAAGKRTSPMGSRSSSPYASPVEPNGDRGRSMQRLSQSSPLASPMRPVKLPPLSRVTEESVIPELGDVTINPDNLVDVEESNDSSDVPTIKKPVARNSTLARADSSAELLQAKEPENSEEPPKASSSKQPATVEDGALKTIEI